MVYALIGLIFFVVGFVVAIMLVSLGLDSLKLGSLKIIYVGNRVERTQLVFNDHDAKNKMKSRSYVLLNIETVCIQDPDEDTTQNLQVL